MRSPTLSSSAMAAQAVVLATGCGLFAFRPTCGCRKYAMLSELTIAVGALIFPLALGDGATI